VRSRLEAVEGDLTRLAEFTVPLQGLVSGFDSSFAEVDGIFREASAALDATEKMGLFDGDWIGLLGSCHEAWMTEFDCVLNEQRNELDRRGAADRAVAALASAHTALAARIRRQIQRHVR